MSTEDNRDNIDSIMFGTSSQIVVSICCAAILIFGEGGNGLVIYFVLAYKEMRTKINNLILSLAVADSLNVLLVPFITIPYVLPLYPFGNIWCKINQYAVYVGTYANVYTLVLMSMNRYLAVVHSIWSIPYLTMRNTCIAAISVWIISIFGNIPTIIHFEEYQYTLQNQTRSTCGIKPTSGQLFYGPFFVFAYLLPVTLICIMYVSMVCHLYRKPVSGIDQTNQRMHRKKRATRLVVTVVVVYALCLLPVNILFLLHHFSAYERNSVTFVIETISYALGTVTSCVNPFIYAFVSEEFRGKFKSILCNKIIARNGNRTAEGNQSSSDRATPFVF